MLFVRAGVVNLGSKCVVAMDVGMWAEWTGLKIACWFGIH